ncbi:autotransporter domain-containing protein [Phreatobacter sp. AB_2022a]|uniref:autotransporter domain-containing protein n=1 Tax=Phreatobacter sp. AB_2022a TaxID=3003134 RepID=UPI00228720C2|nr:autotransporter domain-containing protein [Phreatobacter sp. AB_2022a]MCZ0734454.1 autotransporter domain-containing protein [Phreatobacter sp. AB_2022a]
MNSPNHSAAAEAAGTIRAVRMSLSGFLRGTTALHSCGLPFVALTALGLSTMPATAQCASTGGSAYSCSGANTTTQTILANNAAVTTVPGFGVDTTVSGGHGLTIGGAGALSYIDGNSSSIVTGMGGAGLVVTVTGDDGPTAGSVVIQTNGTISAANGAGGVMVINAGSGANDVTATGEVTGGAYGIFALGGGGTTVKAGVVTGGTYGIYIDGQGTGAVSAAATGQVTGTLLDGIRIFNTATGSSVTVNATGVSGGLAGISAENRGAGATLVTASGDVVGARTYGILAANGTVAFNPDGTVASVAAGAASGLTVNAATVTGAITGIYASNQGTGAALVTATGLVTGTAETGIFVSAGAGAGAVTVNAASVTGGRDGLQVLNGGTGTTVVTASGQVTGSGNYGILAVNSGAATDLTVQAAGVSGVLGGLTAANNGTGNTFVTTTGHVTGDGYAIAAAHATTAGNITVRAASAAGGVIGLFVVNQGRGATDVAATGDVVGSQNYGILAMNGVPTANPDNTIASVAPVSATDLKVTATAPVSGGVTGIYASNYGTGATVVTATGLVTGIGSTGIFVENGATAGNLTLNAAAVTGRVFGIDVVNKGTGDTLINATGQVTGTLSIGIVARNEPTAHGLTVNATAASGDKEGIGAVNDGTGDTSVTATGPATGNQLYGINVTNGAAAGRLTVNAAAASGGISGINTFNQGTGPTSITTSGLIEGGTSAIAASSAGQPITINANGLTRNASGLSTSLAIEVSGGPAMLTNGGTLVGTVLFDAGAHSMANNGAWNSAGGTSQFGGGVLVNGVGGTLIAASGGGAPVTTVLDGLGSLTNRGLITMVDGVTGDILRQTGGNAVLQSGSVLAIDVSGTSQSDRFVTTGTATLTGSTLSAKAPGLLSVGSRYTVLTADGGVIGTFGSVTGGSAFRVLRDSYDANNAYLDVVGRAFVEAAATRNQVATARALDMIAPSGPLYDAIMALPTDSAARDAFDRLSGEIHASAKTALIEDSGFLREAAIGRLRSAFGTVAAASAPVNMADINGRLVTVAPTTERFAIWGQGYGAWGRTNGDGNAAGLKHSTGGFFLGFDGPVLDTWRIGLLAGYSRTSFNVRDRASSGTSDNYHLGAFAGTQWGPIGLRSGLAFTWHELATTRTVSFAGFGDLLRARYGARTFQAFGEAGYRIDAFGAAFEPFVSLAHVSLATDAFSETGGAAALTGEGRTTATTFTTLGLRASTSFMLGSVSTTARGTLGWRHSFGAVLPLATNAFAGGAGFTVAGVPIARDAAVIEAGLDFALSPAATLGVSYAGQIAGSAQQHGFKGSLAVRF